MRAREERQRGGGKTEDMCEAERDRMLKRREEKRREEKRREEKRRGFFSSCRNKVTQNSFIKDQAQLNKQHLDTSNRPTAV